MHFLFIGENIKMRSTRDIIKELNFQLYSNSISAEDLKRLEKLNKKLEIEIKEEILTEQLAREESGDAEFSFENFQASFNKLQSLPHPKGSDSKESTTKENNNNVEPKDESKIVKRF